MALSRSVKGQWTPEDGGTVTLSAEDAWRAAVLIGDARDLAHAAARADLALGRGAEGLRQHGDALDELCSALRAAVALVDEQAPRVAGLPRLSRLGQELSQLRRPAGGAP